MVEADFGDPHLAGIAEAAGIARSWHAVLIIGVDLHGRAGGVGLSDYRAARALLSWACQRQDPGVISQRRLLVPVPSPPRPQARQRRGRASSQTAHQRRIEARPLHIAAQQGVGGIVLPDQVRPVIEEPCGRARHLRCLVEAACRVPRVLPLRASTRTGSGEGDVAGAAAGDAREPVVEVIGIGPHPVRGHIAAIVVRVGDTPAGEEAVEAIDGDGDILVGMAGKGIDVIGS